MKYIIFDDKSSIWELHYESIGKAFREIFGEGQTLEYYALPNNAEYEDMLRLCGYCKNQHSTVIQEKNEYITNCISDDDIIFLDVLWQYDSPKQSGDKWLERIVTTCQKRQVKIFVYSSTDPIAAKRLIERISNSSQPRLCKVYSNYFGLSKESYGLGFKEIFQCAKNIIDN